MRIQPIHLLVIAAGLSLSAGSAVAQEAEPQPPEHHHMAMPPSEMGTPTNPGWTWTGDANVFFGYNYQKRLFADFSALESQNWFMLSGEHALGRGRLTVMGMLSLEPFTLGKLVWVGNPPEPVQTPIGGSPQLFQTGESFQGEPLVNVQHPHDLLMGLGLTYRIQQSRVTYVVGADLVGSPTLGPTAFMHRESARDNPQVPISHHDLDSTHVTPGVVRGGIETGPWAFEASVFRGEEPDENHTNIELPGLNSWAARVRWHQGPWDAQVSGGRLRNPEWFEPYETTKLTASMGFNGEVASRPLAATLAWGHHSEDNGYNDHADSFLLEWDLRVSDKTALYGRAEAAEKQIFGLGLHPAGFNHPHFYSHIRPLTLGIVRDIAPVRYGRLGIGADITVYGMSQDMVEYFDGSQSFHVFLRWRPAHAAMAHVH